MPRRQDLKSICLIGSGPIVIGQACEFDYAGCQALKVLREDGFRTIVVNSNPATIMTDPGFADATYLEPLDLEGVADVLGRERPDALLPTLGGQTALNLAIELADAGTGGAGGVFGVGTDSVGVATLQLPGGRPPARAIDLIAPLGHGQRGMIIAPPRVTIREKIDMIAKVMKEVERSSFRALLDPGASRLEIVVTFLAMLELVKRYRIHAHQEDLFSDIEINRMEEWKDDEEIDIEFE